MKSIAPILVALTAVALLPVQGSGQSATFIKAEYWVCPAENIEPLSQAADSIWGPLFDELVAEERIISWTALAPTSAVAYEKGVERTGTEEVPPPWDWIFSWSAMSEEAFDSSWEILVERLVDRFPDDPRPWLFCDSVTIVDYEIRFPK